MLVNPLRKEPSNGAMAQQVVMCLAALRLALRARRLAVPERRCREQHTARASGGRMSTVLNALYDRRGCDSFCFPALCPAAFGGFTYVRPLSLGVSSRSLGLRRVPSMAITVRHADTLAVCPCVCLAPLRLLTCLVVPTLLPHPAVTQRSDKRKILQDEEILRLLEIKKKKSPPKLINY